MPVRMRPNLKRGLAIDELEKLANSLLALKRSSLPRRPIVIEFCGSPKSGKTSCINSLAIFLRRNGLRTIVVAERAGVCPINNKFDPSFNIWTGCTSLVQLAEILANHSRDYDVVILDRGLFDAVCWFHWQVHHSKLDQDHYRRFIEFFLSPRWLAKTDLLYIFRAQPDVSLQREYSMLLTRKLGSVMNPTVLSSFNESIEACRLEFDGRYKRVRQIHTDAKDQDQVSYDVTKDILETLDDLISEKIGYFPRSLLEDVKGDTFDPSMLFERVRKLEYASRIQVEKNKSALQPLPVAVITDLESRHVIVARKARKATSDSSPERHRDLIYFGGHIREEDQTLNPRSRSIAEIASWSLWRELKEELDIDYVPGDHPELCIWDRANPRSAMHVAIVHHVRLDLNSIKLVTDKLEFTNRGVQIVDSKSIFEKKYRFERWSQLILARILGWRDELI